MKHCDEWMRESGWDVAIPCGKEEGHDGLHYADLMGSEPIGAVFPAEVNEGMTGINPSEANEEER